MKKLLSFLMFAIIGLATFSACSDDENIITPEPEPTPQPQPTPEAVSYKVVASMDETTRAIFNDGEQIKWSDSDVVTAWFIDAEGNYAYANREEASVEKANMVIAEDALTATFNFTTLPVGGKAWLALMSNTGYDGCSARKVEFNYTSNQTQQAAGTINSEYVKLRSSALELSEGEGEITLSTKMQVVGTIMRFLPYSSTGAYAAEKVKYVELVSADNAIAGAGSAIAYNFAEYHNTEAGYKWWGNDAGTVFSDECVIFWDATSKSIRTTLETALSLEGVTAANPGTGIYMAVPPVGVGGYKYIIETDVARYTFDSSSEALTFDDNTIKNVLLNLENENVTRIDLSSIKGELQYTGDVNAASNIISYEGTTDKDGGYWYAQTKDTGAADWVTREGAENAQFYTGVKFEAIDNATGEVAEWLTVSYRTDGNTHWWIHAEPQVEGAAERSATVTATFSDVDGYLVTEACRTKVVTITQQAYSTSKELGFYGGVGDQVISGGNVVDQSLGYCVITVNGIYAEDWAGDSHNEQALYGNVVIECREGAANGSIVDWLTVGYGKDAEGRFNTTHLLANATENTTGAERKALVCCTYNAPEGYTFSNGQTSFFRQFMVTQPVNSALKTIEFWGGLAAEYSHDHTAQTAWGLSYWVVNVDGATATDWNGDSHNEQAIYGSAEFKCYDYTNGVRGEEVDWVTVAYKTENGKVIDTWWLADIQENTTGAVRKAEIVCTFPELEGYTYKDGQNVRSTIIVQNPASTGEEGGDDDGGEVQEGMSYTIFNNAADGSKGTGFGPGAGTVGDWYRFEGVTINGKTYTPGDELKNLAANTELMGQLMAQAFAFGEITEDDVQIPGTDPLTTNPESFVTLEAWCDGGAAIYVRIVLSQNDTGARRTFKIITKNPDGSQKSSIVYFQNA